MLSSRLRVGIGVFGHGVERRMHGARLRQRQAGVQAEPFRRVVDGDDLGIAALAVDDERRCDAQLHATLRCGRSRAGAATG